MLCTGADIHVNFKIVSPLILKLCAINKSKLQKQIAKVRPISRTNTDICWYIYIYIYLYINKISKSNCIWNIQAFGKVTFFFRLN